MTAEEAAMIMMSGGSAANPTEQLIDQAPALATIDLGSWSMVFKKVDALQKNRYSTIRSEDDSNDWQTRKTDSYAMTCMCVYCGNTLKWVSDLTYVWRLSADYYKYDRANGEYVFWKYYQVRWGIATGDSDDNTTFAENIIRITDVKPILPSKTSEYVKPGMVVTWLYDEQVIHYNYDGSIDNLHYNRNLTRDTGYLYADEMELCFGTNEKDYSAFCEAVMAYVNQ